MIKTRQQLLDEIERGTLARVRDLLRRGSALFEATPEWDPPKEPSKETTHDGEEPTSQDWENHAGEMHDYASKLHDALEQLHAELVDFESDAAQALVDFDKLTEQYDVERLPGAGS
jgi:hypothetical protein